MRLFGVLVALGLMLGSQAMAADRSVVLLRDDFGVPHIFAKDEAAGFYGLGYAMAEDRLERLALSVLFVRGELAAVAGPAYVENDAQARLWRHREMGERGAKRLSPRLRRDYEAFAAGVKAFVPTKPLPAGLQAAIDGLDVADLVALPRGMFYAGYHIPAARAECRVGGMTYSPGMLPYRRLEDAPASNGWVVGPSRTADGALILAADPHVETESFAYYEYHLEAGDLRSAGFALGPALWQAHNADVAWAMTTGNPDFLDCYAVETDPADPRAWRFDGRPRRMEIRTETIAVAGGASVVRTFEYTRHNGVLSPVVARKGTVAYVASSADMDRSGEMAEEFLLMNRARNVGEVRAALRTMSMFPQNLMIGDRAGRILYLRAGRAPVRPRGFDWTGPVPGNSSATTWKGVHRIGDLVQLADPPAGYLQSNNVAPDTISPGAVPMRVTLDLFNDAPGRLTTRGVRTLQVLGQHPKLSLEQAMDLAMDETWVTASDWTAGLRWAIKARPAWLTAASPETRAVVERLLAFDGRAAAGSEAAADFWFWRRAAAAPVTALEDGAFVAWPWDRSKFDAALAEVMLEALDRSLQRRREVYGTTRQKLGDVMRFSRGATAEWPAGGVSLDSDQPAMCLEQARAVCDRTMRAFGVAPIGDTGRMRIVRGSQAMRLIQFSDPIQAYSLYAFGQSDDPTSPHYADQARLFSEGRMKPAYFSREALAGHVRSERILTYDPAIQ